MKNVTILAMFNTMASTVTGPMDIFYQAGVLWNFFSREKVSPYFKVKIVSSIGAPFRCLNGARIIPEHAMNDVRDTDLIIVSSILDISRTLQVQPEVIDWLIERYERGAHIATICTGAFVLAETGLLDGKTATTHWGYADQFSRRYPQIDFKPERLITDEGDLFTSGGYTAGVTTQAILAREKAHLATVRCIIAIAFPILWHLSGLA